MFSSIAAFLLLASFGQSRPSTVADEMPPDVFVDWNSHNAAGWTAIGRNRLDVAEREFRHAIAKARPYASEDPRLLARSYCDLAWTLYLEGRAEEAHPLAEWALLVRESRVGPNSEPCAQNLSILAMIEAEIDRPDLAEAHLVKLVAVREKRDGRSSPTVAAALLDLATVQLSRRKYPQARTALERILAMPTKNLDADAPERGRAHLGLADVDEARGELKDALAHLEEALERLRRVPDEDPEVLKAMKARRDDLAPKARPAEPRPLKSAAIARKKRTRDKSSLSPQVSISETFADRPAPRFARKSERSTQVRTRTPDGGRAARPERATRPTSSHSAVDQQRGRKKTMATKTSAAAGDFATGSNWVGGVAPVSGDLVVFSHAMTWAPAAGSSFTLGVSGTSVPMYFNAGGSLTVNPLGSFTLVLTGAAGAWDLGGNTARREFTVNAVNGPVSIVFDASSISGSLGFYPRIGNRAAQSSGGWSLNGTSANHISVSSLPTSGRNSCFDYTSAANGGGCVSGAYVDFLRIGTASDPALWPRTAGGANVSLANCTFTSCGQVKLVDESSSVGSISLTDVTLAQSLHANPLYCSFGGASSKTFRRVSIDAMWRWDGVNGASFYDCMFNNGWTGNTGVTHKWTTMDGCFIRQTTDSLATAGSVTNCFLFYDKPGTTANGGTGNPHWLSTVNGIPAGSTISLDGNVVYYSGDDANGNVFLSGITATAHTVTCRNNLVLLNAAGLASGALFTSDGNPTNGFGLVIEHNTAYVDGQWALEIGHLYTSLEATNRYQSVKSNLAVRRGSGANGYKAYNPDGPNYVDVIPPAICDYNGSNNIRTTSGTPGLTNEGRGYGSKFTTTPGANDVDGVDPGFVDPTRTLAAWAVAQGSKSPSRTVNEADAVSYVQANPALASALVAWIRAGHAPTHTAYRRAAHDGGDIGAVPVQHAFSARRSSTVHFGAFGAGF